MSNNHLSANNGPRCRCMCFIVLGVTLLSGCASRTTRKTASINRAKNVKASASELSSRNQTLLARYSSEIETAADEIILESPSPSARRQSLVWKSEAIPVLQVSLLNDDPIAAIVDTWAFLFQMSTYMEQPRIKEGFGQLQAIPSATIKKMDAEMERLILTAAPSANISYLRQTISAWAAAHPIQAGLNGRESADADLIRQTSQEELGALASIKALQESMGDITARLDSYNAYLPKQARWQAELMVMDLTRAPEMGSAATNFTLLTRALVNTSNNLDRLPDLAGKAREVALADVQGQRLAAQEFLREERGQIIDALTQQRVAAMADLRGERLAATADLRGERQIILDSLHTEETGAMKDLNSLSQKTLDDFDKRSHRLIDHLFWRALELVLIAIAFTFFLVWVFLRRSLSKILSDRRDYRHAA